MTPLLRWGGARLFQLEPFSNLPVISPLLSMTSTRSHGNLIQEEPLAHSFSNTDLSKRAHLKLSSERSHKVTLKNCIVGEEPLRRLIHQISQNKIQDLSLIHCTLKREKIPDLFSASCLSTLEHFTLLETPLIEEDLKGLEDLLFQSQIKSLKLSVKHGVNIEGLRTAAKNLGIHLETPWILQKSDPLPSLSPSPKTKRTSFISEGMNRIIQGGFQSFKIIEGIDDLHSMTPFLKSGFAIGIIRSDKKKGFEILGITLTIAPGRGFILPINHDLKGLSKKMILREIKTILEDPLTPKTFVNYRADYLTLEALGIHPKGLFMDLRTAKKLLPIQKILYLAKKAKACSIPDELKSDSKSPYFSKYTLLYAKSQASLLYEIFLSVQKELENSGKYGIFSKVLIPLEEIFVEKRAQKLPVRENLLETLKGDILSENNKTRNHIRLYRKLNDESAPENKKGYPLFFHLLSSYFFEKSEPVETILESGNEFGSIERRLLQKELFLTQLMEKVTDGKLSVVYRTPDLFSGVKTVPPLHSLSYKMIAEIFSTDPSREIVMIDFKNLNIRALAHLSKDKTLQKICNFKSKSLEKSINKKVFQNNDHLKFSSLLNDYSTGYLSEETLNKRLGSQSRFYFQKYFETFPNIKEFVDTSKESPAIPNYGVYRKVRTSSNLYFSLFLVTFLKKLKTDHFDGQFLLADEHRLFVEIKKERSEALQNLADEVNKGISMWNVSVPFSLTKRDPEEEEPFLNEPLQGVVPDIEETLLRPENLIPLSSSPSTLSQDLQQKLQKTLDTQFNRVPLKPKQIEVISHILNGKPTVALLPTGYGKSLCFQVPALMLSGKTIVISPLVSLIENQVQDLQKKGINTLWIRSKEELDTAQSNEQMKVLYITPELLSAPMIQKQLHLMNISLFVIDEAHCIYEWGNTFRESYRKLGLIKEEFPKANILALSATMRKETLDDLITSLNLKNSKLIQGSLLRKNLQIRVVQKTEIYQQLKEFLATRLDRAGIIYCQKKEDVNNLFIYLCKQGILSGKYHAGMTPLERKRSLKEFLSNEKGLMIATVAFGMGIDKPNIRFVCHIQMPGSLEQYYQEIGRAGRDGKSSECVLFYSDKDFIESLILKKEAINPNIQKEIQLKTNQIFHFTQSTECRQTLLSQYFTGAKRAERCGSCDICTETTQKFDAQKEVLRILEAILISNGDLSVSSLSKFLCGNPAPNISIDLMLTSLFGALKGHPINDVRSLIRHLIHTGYISKHSPHSNFLESSLQLTPRAEHFLNTPSPFITTLFSNYNPL